MPGCAPGQLRKGKGNSSFPKAGNLSSAENHALQVQFLVPWCEGSSTTTLILASVNYLAEEQWDEAIWGSPCLPAQPIFSWGAEKAVYRDESLPGRGQDWPSPALMNHPKFWLQPWNVTSPISLPTTPRDHPRGLKNLITLPPLPAEPPFTPFSLFFESFHLFRLQVLICCLLLISLHRKMPNLCWNLSVLLQHKPSLCVILN